MPDLDAKEQRDTDFFCISLFRQCLFFTLEILLAISFQFILGVQLNCRLFG